MKKRRKRRSESAKPIKINFRFLGALTMLFVALFLKFNPSYLNKTFNIILGTDCDYNMMFSDIFSVIGKHTLGEKSFKMPVEGIVTSPFGERENPDSSGKENHTGIDISVPENSNVRASRAGKVIRVEENQFYGKFIMIDHKDNLVSLYGHLNEQTVKIDDEVTSETVIGLSGNTGRSTGPHLHFEIRKEGECVNPEDYLK